MRESDGKWRESGQTERSPGSVEPRHPGGRGQLYPGVCWGVTPKNNTEASGICNMAVTVTPISQTGVTEE